ncbi:6380_t:CDS:1, partial [Racocetra persica]
IPKISPDIFFNPNSTNLSKTSNSQQPENSNQTLSETNENQTLHTKDPEDDDVIMTDLNNDDNTNINEPNRSQQNPDPNTKSQQEPLL